MSNKDLIEDKNYCMSSFLMLRTIYDHQRTFKKGIVPNFFEENSDRQKVKNSIELEEKLREEIEKVVGSGKKVALALSGGIDSAILAKFLPAGTTAYTFKCVVPGVEVTNEAPRAAKYAEECGLKQKVVEVYWEDFEKFTPILMRHKGMPFHSIEVQIYKAALEAKKDGVDVLIFGESSDVNFGGQDGLLSKDWTVGDYIERYSYVLPYKVLNEPKIISEPFLKYSQDGFVDAHEFNRHIFYCEAMGTYTNATEAAKIELNCPYSKTYLGVPLDLGKIRNGRSKYLVREIFERLYPNFEVPEKIPMPRPMNEWFKDWTGPSRPEFIPRATDNMTGDQKWLIWCLEQFLNYIDNS